MYQFANCCCLSKVRERKSPPLQSLLRIICNQPGNRKQMNVLQKLTGRKLLRGCGSHEPIIKMLLTLLFSVAFTFLYIYIIFHQWPLILLPRQVLQRCQGCLVTHLKIHIFYLYLYPRSQPAAGLPLAPSRAEPNLPAGPVAPRAGSAPQLPRAGGESHRIPLVPGHLVLLQVLVVCARLVSSGNRRSLKCQRGGLTNSAGINFHECMFLRKTAKLKKKKI